MGAASGLVSMRMAASLPLRRSASATIATRCALLYRDDLDFEGQRLAG